MPVKHALHYLPVAQEDLVSILDYIAKDSPSRALRFIEKLDDRIMLLEQNPNLGRVPRYPRLREYGYRVLIVESYLIFYIIRRQTIEIPRVVRGSRHLDHLV